jgi:DNA polymerase-3 subunit epsilon
VDYLAIDFETASGRDAVCAVGLYRFGVGGITSEHHLIDPEIDADDWDPMAMFIHGIRPEMVQGCMPFPAAWQRIQELSQNSILLAHNAAFDMSVLRYSFGRYDIVPHEFEYICSAKIAKGVWPELPTTRLEYVGEFLELDFFHHDPEEDARASAEVFQIAAKKHYGAYSPDLDIYAFLEDLKLRPGVVMPDLQYRPCGVKSSEFSGFPTRRGSNYKSDPNRQIDINHPLYEAHVAFTGTLSSMNRPEAFARLHDLAGIPEANVTKKTRYLVAGTQDIFRLRPGSQVSAKMEKAIKLAASGHPIEIIGEDDFLKLVLS